MSLYQQYTSQEWEKRFRAQAKKIFFTHPEMIDDAFQAGWLRLIEKLQQCKKNEISDAYVMSMYKSCLFDEYRKHFGRCRPYAWVCKQGKLWEDVAVELCRKNASTEEIAYQVIKQGDEVSAQTHLDKVKSIISRLQAKSYCSTLGSQEVQVDDLNAHGDQQLNPAHAIQTNELSYLLQTILSEKSETLGDNSVSEKILQQRPKLAAQLSKELSDSDRILLRLVFVDEQNIASAARALNTTAAKLRYQLQKILKTLENIFLQFEINLEYLLV